MLLKTLKVKVNLGIKLALVVNLHIMNIHIRFPKVLILGILAFFLCTSAKWSNDLFEYSKNIEIFNAAFKEVGENYMEEVTPGDLMRKGLDAMLASLDPYTNFYSESQAEDARIEQQGEYGGVGCGLILRNGYPVVSDIVAGYAFAEADIRHGDILKKISGADMKGKTINQVRVFLRGAENTSFNLTIERNGEELEKNVIRKQIKQKNVPYFGVAKENIGYIHLDEFGQNAAMEIRNAYGELKAKNKIQYLILDLRNNGGGLLHEAVNIVGLFVGSNKLIVNMRGKSQSSNRPWLSENAINDLEIPLIVLVNSGSASASEVVSASLQDLDRAIIVGRNSFGKGLVQNYFQLPYGTQMKITTAKYYTPSGRCVQLKDYSKRNTDGSAKEIPLDKRKAFKTKNGRTVYDGGGVQPDVVVDEFAGQALFKLMMDEYLIFDFANEYRNKNNTIGDIANFSLPQVDFEKFKNESVIKLTEIIKNKLNSFFKDQLKDADLAKALIDNAAFLNKIETQVREKIQLFQKELKSKIETEIVKRYNSKSGIYELSFKIDPDLLESYSLFANPQKMESLFFPK